jgi:hypothetical protein
MVHEGDRVAIFHSVHKVMKAEKLLKLAKVEMLLIPVPRELSSDCGLAIRFAADVFNDEGKSFGKIVTQEDVTSALIFHPSQHCAVTHELNKTFVLLAQQFLSPSVLGLIDDCSPNLTDCFQFARFFSRYRGAL